MKLLVVEVSLDYWTLNPLKLVHTAHIVFSLATYLLRKSTS